MPPEVQGQPPASDWVARWLQRWSGGRQLLDYACGSGRHARLAAKLGYQVLALDRDPSGFPLMRAQSIGCLEADLESGPWPDELTHERFDVLVCTHYLFRPRLDLLLALIKAPGLLLYETFAQGQALYGRPGNPDFLLRPGELLRTAQGAGFHVLAYEDGVVSRTGLARIQRLAAVRAPHDLAGLPLDS